MGTYWVVINLDKMECISLGMNFMEWLMSDDPKVIFWLLAENAYFEVWSEDEESFSGICKKFKYLGKWAKDRIAVIRNIGTHHDLLYRCKDITLGVLNDILKLYKMQYSIDLKAVKSKDLDKISKEIIKEDMKDLERLIRHFKTWKKIYSKDP